VFLVWVFIASMILYRRELRVPKNGAEMMEAAKARAKASKVLPSAQTTTPVGPTGDVAQPAGRSVTAGGDD